MSEDLVFRVTSNCLIHELLKIFLVHMNQPRKLMPWNLFPYEKMGLSWKQTLPSRKDLGNLLTLQKKSIHHHFCTTSRNVSSLLIYLKTPFFFWSACYEMDPFLSTRKPSGNRTKIAIVVELTFKFYSLLHWGGVFIYQSCLIQPNRHYSKPCVMVGATTNGETT